jgi:hypothetical protein
MQSRSIRIEAIPEFEYRSCFGFRATDGIKEESVNVSVAERFGLHRHPGSVVHYGQE